MGVKHLEKIKQSLKEEKKFVTKGYLRGKLNITDSAAQESLNYLINEGQVFTQKNSKTGFEEYKWIGD